MSRDTGQVTRRQAGGWLLAAAVLGAAMWLLSGWLLPRAQPQPTAEAAAEDDNAPQGAVLCPSPDELPPPEQPVQTTSTTLIDCPKLFDGRLVIVEGEAIGALLRRGPSAWVQLNDDRYATAGPLPSTGQPMGQNSGMPVLLPGEAARRVGHLGSFNTRGDVLRVTGRFTSADPDAGGALTVRAMEVVIARPGEPIRHPLMVRRVWVAAAAAALALLVWLLARRACGDEPGQAHPHTHDDIGAMAQGRHPS